MIHGDKTERKIADGCRRVWQEKCRLMVDGAKLVVVVVDALR